MPETRHKSQNLLKDAVAKLTEDNIDRIKDLKIAKDFTNIGCPFVGFKGKDKKGQDFQLRVDYDPVKNGHVNVTVNGNEKHSYEGENRAWFVQVVNNINGASYCGVPQDNEKTWQTSGQEENVHYIEGMKKYIRQFV